MTEKDYNPLISIIIPTFNREKLIAKTLDSVLIQTYHNWECIIVDDGSSDNSYTIIDKYLNKDNRFHFTKRNREPKGASTCRNIGTNMASGEYLIFLDSDDVLDTLCLENRVNKVLNPLLLKH
jgi:glycosyltransferase involved in cell wall biosynthesis